MVGSCDMPVYAMCMRHACSFARYVRVEVICMLKQHATCMLHECLDDMHVTVMLTYTYTYYIGDMHDAYECIM